MFAYLKDHEGLRNTLDYLVAPGAIVGSLLGWLPAVSAALAITWYGIQIYDRYKYGPKK